MDELIKKVSHTSRTICAWAMVIILFFLGLALLKKGWQYRKKQKNQAHIEAAKVKAEGIIFGLDEWARLIYSPAQEEGHCAVFGGSGSGKTSAILIPTLRSWIQCGGTCFAIDISGDINSNVPCDNKLVYAPGAAETIPYNIFGPIDAMTDKDDQDEALNQLAILLMPDLPNATANATYFQEHGRNILTAALKAFYYEGLDFPEICKMIVGNDYNTLFSMIDKTECEAAIMLINNFVGISEANTAGCKQNTDKAVMLFATNGKIQKSIRRPRPGEMAFTPEVMETHSIFVVVPDEKLKLYSPLLRIISAQCLDYFKGRPQEYTRNILFCLDEFASLKLDITEALQKFRKKHIRIMFLTQNLVDLDDALGAGAYKSLLGNCDFKIILGVSEMDSQRYFANLIGQTQQKKISTTSTGAFGRTSITTSTQKDYIIEPYDLANLGDELILLYPGGYKRLHKNFYYKREK